MNTQNETLEQPADQAATGNNPPPSLRIPQPRAPSVIAPQTGCPTCGSVVPEAVGGSAAAAFVYAIGRVEARFPNLSAEKEFAQATGRADTAGQTDQQTFSTVLSRRENRYLARQLC
jgi:hypothetical protein